MGNRFNSIDEMRRENKINREKESLLNQIEKDVSLIDNWSIERLLKLEKIYDAKIESYDNEITMIKNKYHKRIYVNVKYYNLEKI